MQETRSSELGEHRPRRSHRSRSVRRDGFDDPRGCSRSGFPRLWRDRLAYGLTISNGAQLFSLHFKFTIGRTPRPNSEAHKTSIERSMPTIVNQANGWKLQRCVRAAEEGDFMSRALAFPSAPASYADPAVVIYRLKPSEEQCSPMRIDVGARALARSPRRRPGGTLGLAHEPCER
jgi:hypothetical protein